METLTKSTTPKPKKQLGEVHVIIERCKGCEICVEFCPTGVLQMAASFTPKGYHFPEVANPQWCTACGLCETYCPDFAIYITNLKKSEERGND